MFRADGSRRRARGIALVLVLWVLALLTIMALGLTTIQRSDSAVTRNQLDGARFRALADAAIALTAVNLLAAPTEMQEADSGAQWVPDGTPRPLVFDDTELTVRLTNEASRLDLNVATKEQLAALVDALLGGDEDGDIDAEQTQAVDALVDAIIDWRDPDDMTQLNGAEDSDYAAAGLPYGARDGPFESVLESRQVLGMTPDLYRLLAAEVTVDNPNGQVDAEFASAAVLAAVQGLTLEQAQDQVALRTAPPDADVVSRVVNRGGPLYRLRIGREVGDDARQTMEALVRIEAGGTLPYQVLWRREGLWDEAEPAE